MAEFRTMVITNKGQALIAKMLAGKGNIQFTKISLSDSTYTDAQILAMGSISGVKQTASISRITKTSSAAVKIEGAVSNAALKTGYYIRTIALHAMDPDDGDIVYAACGATTPGWMPPYNGVSTSGCYLNLVTTVQNASNVTVTVDPAGVATIGDIKDLQSQVDDLQAFVGYNDEDIYGVEVDFQNKRFTRLAGAKNLTPGLDFDNLEPWKRRRCNLADDGTVNAYYNEAGYTEDGSNGQVMVEQPKFWYKVVPLVLEKRGKVELKNSEGEVTATFDGDYDITRKVRYYVSGHPKSGFKVHPAFIKDGKELDKIYVSAFEASVYDASASKYITDDMLAADTAADKLSSIAGVKPVSGNKTNLTRNGARQLAHNRGAGWEQSTVQAVTATELLFLIEYGNFNTQADIGSGNVNRQWLEDGINWSGLTGATSSLGNASGMVPVTVDGQTEGAAKQTLNMVSYRGEENFWGDIWTWMDGLNHYKTEIYIADHGFKDDTGDTPYEFALHCSPTEGFVSAFSYDEKYDWLFCAGETVGNNALPVSDYFYVNPTYGWLVAILGGCWDSGLNAGGFGWGSYDPSSNRDRSIGARLLYAGSGK